MSAFDDARALVSRAERDLPTIKSAYQGSLNAKTISAVLLIDIKNYCENLRSALDYVACGLFERYGSSPKSAKPRVYFPYAKVHETREHFEKGGRLDTNIPGLDSSRPDIKKLIVEMQHFGSESNAWLPRFMELTNENKHQRLTPQVRKNTKELRISSGGTSISVGQGTTISVGHGTTLSIGSAVIRGGQVFDVNTPPRVEGGRVEVVTWVSFHFADNDQPVLPLLESALKGVGKIVNDLSAA